MVFGVRPPPGRRQVGTPHATGPVFFGPGRKFDGQNLSKKFNIRNGIWNLAAAGTAPSWVRARGESDFWYNLLFCRIPDTSRKHGVWPPPGRR